MMGTDEVEKYQMIHTVRFAKILSQKSALIATKIATFDVTVNTKTKQPSHGFFSQIRQVYYIEISNLLAAGFKRQIQVQANVQIN